MSAAHRIGVAGVWLSGLAGGISAWRTAAGAAWRPAAVVSWSAGWQRKTVSASAGQPWQWHQCGESSCRWKPVQSCAQWQCSIMQPAWLAGGSCIVVSVWPWQLAAAWRRGINGVMQWQRQQSMASRRQWLFWQPAAAAQRKRLAAAWRRRRRLTAAGGGGWLGGGGLLRSGGRGGIGMWPWRKPAMKAGVATSAMAMAVQQ